MPSPLTPSEVAELAGVQITDAVVNEINTLLVGRWTTAETVEFSPFDLKQACRNAGVDPAIYVPAADKGHHEIIQLYAGADWSVTFTQGGGTSPDKNSRYRFYPSE